MGPLFVTLTPNCFKVSFQYPLLVKCIKRIPSARYEAEGRFWEVSVHTMRTTFMMAEWAVGKGPAAGGNVLWIGMKSRVQSMSYLPMPKLEVTHNMLMEPYDYQKEGIAYALEKKRCIMGDEPGLGKTAQAIGVLTVSKAFPALVICPASLKVNWQRELKKFGGLNAVILNDDNKQTWQRFWEMKKTDGRACADVFITNYESLKKYFVKRISRDGRFTLKSVDFDERINLFRTVIIDESHKCKTAKHAAVEVRAGHSDGQGVCAGADGHARGEQQHRPHPAAEHHGKAERLRRVQQVHERYCAGMKKSSHLKELNYQLA